MRFPAITTSDIKGRPSRWGDLRDLPHPLLLPLSLVLMSSSTHSIFVWSLVLAFHGDVDRPLMYGDKQDIHQKLITLQFCVTLRLGQ